MSEKKPIYNEKVKRIIEMLKFKTRDEVAAELNYKNYKSLDMYMRRKNFAYDSQEGQYFPMQSVPSSSKAAIMLTTLLGA